MKNKKNNYKIMYQDKLSSLIFEMLYYIEKHVFKILIKFWLFKLKIKFYKIIIAKIDKFQNFKDLSNIKLLII